MIQNVSNPSVHEFGAAPRYTAVAEGITGEFYLAILVARLVGMQMSQAVSGRGEDQSYASDKTAAKEN